MSDMSALAPLAPVGPLTRPAEYGLEQMFVYDKLIWHPTKERYLANFAFTQIEQKEWLMNWELSPDWTALWVEFSWTSPWPGQDFTFEFPHGWVADKIVSVKHSPTYARFLFRLSLWNTNKILAEEADRSEWPADEEVQ